MAYVTQGDIVEVVLDVFPVDEDGERCHRVQIRGVFPRGAGGAPAQRPGAKRNVYQAFFDVPTEGNVFLIGEGSAGE